MKTGITGTQNGMTNKQKASFYEAFRALMTSDSIEEFHHGDCVGADAEAVDCLPAGPWEIHCHPPLNDRKRAFVGGDVMWPEKDYLPRNRELVNEVDVLFVCPKESFMVQRSGTWSTFRYANALHKKVIFIFPDGSIEERQC